MPVPTTVIAYPHVVSGSATSPTFGQDTVSVTYQDAANHTNLAVSQLLINTALDGRNAFYMGYHHANNPLYSVKDVGTAPLPPSPLALARRPAKHTVYGLLAEQYYCAHWETYTLKIQIKLAAGLSISASCTQPVTSLVSNGSINRHWELTNESKL